MKSAQDADAWKAIGKRSTRDTKDDVKAHKTATRRRRPTDNQKFDPKTKMASNTINTTSLNVEKQQASTMQGGRKSIGSYFVVFA